MCLREIIKKIFKKEKKKEINASKIYSQPGKFAKQAKKETSPLGVVESPLVNTNDTHLLTDRALPSSPASY